MTTTRTQSARPTLQTVEECNNYLFNHPVKFTKKKLACSKERVIYVVDFLDNYDRECFEAGSATQVYAINDRINKLSYENFNKAFFIYYGRRICILPSHKTLWDRQVVRIANKEAKMKQGRDPLMEEITEEYGAYPGWYQIVTKGAGGKAQRLSDNAKHIFKMPSSSVGVNTSLSNEALQRILDSAPEVSDFVFIAHPGNGKIIVNEVTMHAWNHALSLFKNVPTVSAIRNRIRTLKKAQKISPIQVSNREVEHYLNRYYRLPDVSEAFWKAFAKEKRETTSSSETHSITSPVFKLHNYSKDCFIESESLKGWFEMRVPKCAAMPLARELMNFAKNHFNMQFSSRLIYNYFNYSEAVLNLFDPKVEDNTFFYYFSENNVIFASKKTAEKWNEAVSERLDVSRKRIRQDSDDENVDSVNESFTRPQHASSVSSSTSQSSPKRRNTEAHHPINSSSRPQTLPPARPVGRRMMRISNDAVPLPTSSYESRIATAEVSVSSSSPQPRAIATPSNAAVAPGSLFNPRARANVVQRETLAKHKREEIPFFELLSRDMQKYVTGFLGQPKLSSLLSGQHLTSEETEQLCDAVSKEMLDIPVEFNDRLRNLVTVLKELQVHYESDLQEDGNVHRARSNLRIAYSRIMPADDEWRAFEKTVTSVAKRNKLSVRGKH